MSERHVAPLKTIDMQNMQVVHCGKLWDQPCAPSCRCMAGFLEHNESVVSWLQPCGGTVDQQVPSIRLPRGLFCHMSLRMMKAVWRKVRMQKDFVNKEPLSQGGFKLKIPSTLVQDKKKTRQRAMEMKRKFSKASGHCALPPRPQHRAQARPVADRPGADGAAPSAQRSRGATGPAEGRFQQHPGVRQEKRSVSTVCKRVYHLVTNVVVPLSHHIQRLPSKTVFVCNNEDFMQKIFERMCTESPSLLRMEKGKFLTGMGGIFDKYQNESLCPSPSPRGTEQRN